MGYSCTQDAGNMLGVIGKFFATEGNPNILTINGERYFFERGREQNDGAITGKLMLMLPDDYCRSVGAVRIEGDGTLTKIPCLRQVEREEITATFRDMSARNPQLLRAWAMGTI